MKGSTLTVLPFFMSINNAFIRFIIGTVGCYLIWFGLYEFWLKPSGKLDHIITENISVITVKLLEWTGYDARYTIGKKLGETYVFIGEDILPTVRIGASCNGLEMLVIFAFFILWYPGNWWLKFVYVTGGLILIHGLNILRNYILTLLAIERSLYFELFHRYVFIFLIYGFIFLLWMWWANRLSLFYTKHDRA